MAKFQQAVDKFTIMFQWSEALVKKASLDKALVTLVKRRLAEFAVVQGAFREPKEGESRNAMMQTAKMVVDSLVLDDDALHPKINLLLSATSED